jgi:tyrosine-protein phosphatase YwqE
LFAVAGNCDSGVSVSVFPTVAKDFNGGDVERRLYAVPALPLFEGYMFSFFRRKPEAPDLSQAPRDFSFLGTDIHSHLVPGVDDGSPDLENSLKMIQRFQNLGFRKLITTPHVHLDFYNNDSEKLTMRFGQLKEYLLSQNVSIELGLGAEYFLDNMFLNEVISNDLLAFGSQRYLLVEVSMAGWPRQFADTIFSIQSRGYTPVLAHPERYTFEKDIKVFQEWKQKGLLFQMNLLALTGYYGKGIKDAAHLYLDEGLYDFCGSDAHHERHLGNLEQIANERPELMIKLLHYKGWRNREL